MKYQYANFKWRPFNADMKNKKFHQGAGCFFAKREVEPRLVRLVAASPEMHDLLVDLYSNYELGETVETKIAAVLTKVRM